MDKQSSHTGKTNSALDPVQPRRSAHATIRGYLYQASLGVLRWLDLKEGELLLCEGDEDLDRILLDEGPARVLEQVKHLDRAISFVDRPVEESVAGFLHAFVARRREGETVHFVFTTTARRREQRKGIIDVLATWTDPSRRDDVIAAVKNAQATACPTEIAWLDKEPGRWEAFVESVEWDFESPDLLEVHKRTKERLACLTSMPADLLAERLLAKVLEASSKRLPGFRTLDLAALRTTLAETERQLSTWADTKAAENVRAALQIKLADVLLSGRQPLERAPTPGELLLPAHEVTPFFGREGVFDHLEAWWASDAKAEVCALCGPGGAGKTRLLVEWVRRLRARGELSGFLSSTVRAEHLDLLFAGAGPRLAVVDYAETRLALVEDLLACMAERSSSDRPIRLVLLARGTGEWWEHLGRDDSVKRELIEHHCEARRLEDLLADPAARPSVFVSAARAFAKFLRKADVPAPRLADLEPAHFARPLFVQMSALAAVEGKRVTDELELLDWTLEHE